ncbi:MAG: HypC/HybG/HupF family hydrogenase formation chaperone [Candidatus Omnitrophota bacterium]
MCLGIPMRIKKIKGDFADVESARLIRTVNIQMLPKAQVGDYVIVHAGFAIQKLDPARAKETLKMIDEIH